MFCKKICSKCGAPEPKTEETSEQLQEVGQNIMETAGEQAQTGLETADDMAKTGTEKAEDLAGKGRGFWGKLMSGSKKTKIGLGIGVAVLLVLIILLPNASRLNNWIHRTFSSPEKYYHYVEKQTVKDVADIVSEVYGDAMSHANIFDLGVEGEVSIVLSEELRDMIGAFGSLAGADFSMVDWIEKADFSGSMAVKDTVASMNFSVGANKSDLLSLELVKDLENRMMYLKIPEFSSTFLGFESAGMLYVGEDVDVKEYQELTEKFLKAMPNQDTVKKLTSKYLEIALECVDDVDIHKGAMLKAGDVQQNTTRLNITIDEHTAAKMTTAVLEALAKDEDVKKIIQDMAKVSAGSMGRSGLDADPDGVYKAFQERVEAALDHVDENKFHFGEKGIRMELYVDGKGVIRGRSVEMGDDGLSYKMPVKGSQFGYELSSEKSGYFGKTKYTLEGSGEISGDKITGTFYIDPGSGKLPIDIKLSKFHKASLLRGKLNGTIQVVVSDKSKNSLGDSSDANGSFRLLAGLLKDFSLELEAATTGSSTDYTLSVKRGEDVLFESTSKLRISKGSKAEVPSGESVKEIEGPEDLVDWLENVDWDQVISKFEKADLPAEIIDIMKDFVDMMEGNDLSLSGMLKRNSLIGMLRYYMR